MLLVRVHKLTTVGNEMVATGIAHVTYEPITNSVSWVEMHSRGPRRSKGLGRCLRAALAWPRPRARADAVHTNALRPVIGDEQPPAVLATLSTHARSNRKGRWPQSKSIPE